MKLHFALVPVFAVAFGAFACSASDSTETTGTAQGEVRGGGRDDVRPGSHQACNLNSECPSGEECRRHICQIDDHVNPPSSSGDAGECPAGTEIEIEHGVVTCRPHAEHADAGSGASSSGSSAGGAAAGEACATTADCAAGLECEVEVEHGGTTSTCRPHGGI